MDVSAINDDLYPFARLMGVTITRADPEAVEAQLTVREELCNSNWCRADRPVQDTARPVIVTLQA